MREGVTAEQTEQHCRWSWCLHTLLASVPSKCFLLILQGHYLATQSWQHQKAWGRVLLPNVFTFRMLLACCTRNRNMDMLLLLCLTQYPLLGVHCNWDIVLPQRLTDESWLAPNLNEMLSRGCTDVADTDSAKASHIYWQTDVAHPPAIS